MRPRPLYIRRSTDQLPAPGSLRLKGGCSSAPPLPLPAPAPLHCAALGDTIYCLNRQVTATFTVSEGTAQFQAQELQPFPLGSRGVLCPFVLTLPAAHPLQTAL